MPADYRRQHDSSGLPYVTMQRVNNSISVAKYYRSANLLIRQANEYRAQHNDLQLYTMLMRLASLVVETIPTHKDFESKDIEYKNLRKALLTRHVPELETLKVQLKLKMGEDSSAWMNQPKSHTPNIVQISTSNLPQLDWETLAKHPSPIEHARGTDFAQSSTLDFEPSRPPLDLLDSLPSAELSRPSTATDAMIPTFQTSLRSASQAARERHALLPSIGTQPSARKRESGAAGVAYPQFDTTPYSAINYGQSLERQNSAQPPLHPPAQKEGDMRPSSASLMDSDPIPHPSYGPALGPQATEVFQMAPLNGDPDPRGTCSHVPPPDPPPPPPPPEELPGDISGQKEIREVHVSMGLMEEFLAYASSNTRRGVESCGILAGLLDSKKGFFSITTLIVPKQEGTSDTVQALAEEEIFEAQDSRGLYPMGWIHTHPTQTCFLSSIDVHTQCGYQTMLDEAIAIVMAPSDRSKRCGIFRLSTPGGLKLVQKCQSRGFHMHPSTETGQPLYEVSGHVYLNERLKHDVIDLR